MLDVFTALDVALRSRYLSPLDLPTAAVWDRLPAELRSALVVALASGGGMATVRQSIWEVRASQHGKPVWSDEQSTTHVRLKLGMLYLAHLKGALPAGETLARAFHTGYSYVWDRPQQRDFLDRCREVTRYGPDGVNLAVLFEPYLDAATLYVEQWGLA